MKLAALLVAACCATAVAQTPVFNDPANLRGERVSPHDGRELPVDQGARGLQQMLRKLNPEGSEPLWRDATGKVVLTQVPVGTSWIGEPVKALEVSAGTRVAYIDRLGAPIVPQSGTVLQEGDVVHVIALESDVDQITFAFSARERGAH